MATLILFGSFIILMILSVPIAFALGISSVLTLFITEKMPLQFIAQGMFTTVDSYALMAVPLFVFAGLIMEHGGLSRRLIDVAKSFVGHQTGGLAGVAILACTVFAALSGSGPATVAAIGGIMIPAMVKEKYDPGFSSGVVASAGTLGIIIPPSIPLIIYGITTNTSIGDLFIAGIIPGLFIAALLWSISYVISKKRGFIGSGKKATWKERFNYINEAKWTLLMPIVVLGGIYGGIFTPTEAAGIAVAYSAFLGIFIYKEIKRADAIELFKQTILISGIILIIIATASTYGRILTIEKIPILIAEFLTSLPVGSWVILCAIVILLVFIGMFMETLAGIILLAPILLPVVTELGMHPVHFGIVMILAAEIGFLTPPVGDNLNVASAISGLTLEQVAKATLPFTIALIILLFVFMFAEPFIMFLPNLIGGTGR
ncbi:TRAP transporter large permease [Psychrobacillus sp. OK032]|uniref:TRAP transporter large permease n=1 Tax=Psychrobacillus sp. OK032 TaxID=1884358 RepID=UPI0008C3AEA2|nr:TRAP transporter large permease [Psychrobacillus sp. OK032]SES20606.1 C4-dicarboxylate transporter, DctM subunit [Psychrobacillus sp. OK032]